MSTNLSEIPEEEYSALPVELKDGGSMDFFPGYCSIIVCEGQIEFEDGLTPVLHEDHQRKFSGESFVIPEGASGYFNRNKEGSFLITTKGDTKLLFIRRNPQKKTWPHSEGLKPKF